MAPLVPDIISNEFNFVVAILVGFAFGFVLEQAGFSSTKKLVGLFYGYDFTVLKVFFTAGVTAMVGVMLLIHLGMLDAELIYINPTFVRSALVGGLIMGAGFIIGGFCPGTSLCALAIGKIDAFWFVFGSFFGILAFTENYQLFKSFYEADHLGGILMPSMLHISNELFAFLLTAIAVLAFFLTQKIQDKINHHQPVYDRSLAVRYTLYALLPFLVLAIVAFTPSRSESIVKKADRDCKKVAPPQITCDKLAIELVNNNYKINLIDVRSAAEYKKYHLPLAVNIPVGDMQNREWKKYFNQKYKLNYFYADDTSTAVKAYLIAQQIGRSECTVLLSTTQQFKQQILDSVKPSSAVSKQEQQLAQFRADAAKLILEMDAKLKSQNCNMKKTTKKVKGGCS